MADFAAGSGQDFDPYLIQTAQQLQNIGSQTGYLSCYFKLIADIDLTGVSWTPIGTSSNSFIGNFDGNGHSIKNITNPLFNNIYSATIKNVCIDSANISGVGINYCAAFVLYALGSTSNKTKVTNCCVVNSSINGVTWQNGSQWRGMVGGIVCAPDYCEITNCAVLNTTISLSGTTTSTYGNIVRTIGSIVGNADGRGGKIIIISNCYSNATITRPDTYTSMEGIGTSREATQTVQKSVFIGTFSGGKGASRIASTLQSSGSMTISDCYADSALTGYSPIGVNTINGADVSAGTEQGQYNDTYFWNTTLGWDFINTWYWDSTDNLPKLRVFQPKTELHKISVKIGSDWKTVNRVYKYHADSGVWEDVVLIKTKTSSGWKDVHNIID